mmetsp:Transcript_49506/g.67358  ORF Transcript_49506/g.67358 Transcript_49506/m.67358 type:complete len:347 (+) Transcript_49506:451-1491(+)
MSGGSRPFGPEALPRALHGTAHSCTTPHDWRSCRRGPLQMPTVVPSHPMRAMSSTPAPQRQVCSRHVVSSACMRLLEATEALKLLLQRVQLQPVRGVRRLADCCHQRPQAQGAQCAGQRGGRRILPSGLGRACKGAEGLEELLCLGRDAKSCYLTADRGQRQRHAVAEGQLLQQVAMPLIEVRRAPAVRQVAEDAVCAGRAVTPCEVDARPLAELRMADAARLAGRGRSQSCPVGASGRGRCRPAHCLALDDARCQVLIAHGMRCGLICGSHDEIRDLRQVLDGLLALCWCGNASHDGLAKPRDLALHASDDVQGALLELLRQLLGHLLHELNGRLHRLFGTRPWR